MRDSQFNLTNVGRILLSLDIDQNLRIDYNNIENRNNYMLHVLLFYKCIYSYSSP